MTKEEGLSLGETAHPLKSRELKPPVASAAGNRATNKFKEFNADRMVSVQFNPSQQVKESKEPVTSKNIVGMVSGVIAAILTILLIVCLVMGYRYRAASIEGDWTSPTFSEKMLATLKDTANTKNKVSNQVQNLFPPAELLRPTGEYRQVHPDDSFYILGELILLKVP